MNLSRCLRVAAVGLLSVLVVSGPFAPRVGAQPRSGSPPSSEVSPPKPEGEMRWALYVTLAPHWFDPAEVQGRSRRSGCCTRCTTRW